MHWKGKMENRKSIPATIEAAVETCVYLSSHGNITISQPDDGDESGSMIFFHPSHANAVIAAIRRAVKVSRE
jgi:hypothetical protein